MSNLSIFLFILAAQNTVPAYVPRPLLDAQQYTHIEHNMFKRNMDQATIRIGAGDSSQDMVQIGVRVAVPTTPDQHRTLSSIPLARKVFRSDQPGSLALHAIGPYERARGFLTGKFLRQGANRGPERKDFSDDRAFLEGLVRTALARYASRRLHSATHSTIFVAQVKTFRSEGANATLFDLQAWAGARNIKLNRNLEAGTASFVFDGETRIVALGADKVKVGSEWRQLPDMMMEQDNRWFVPVQALE